MWKKHTLSSKKLIWRNIWIINHILTDGRTLILHVTGLDSPFTSVVKIFKKERNIDHRQVFAQTDIPNMKGFKKINN